MCLGIACISCTTHIELFTAAPSLISQLNFNSIIIMATMSTVTFLLYLAVIICFRAVYFKVLTLTIMKNVKPTIGRSYLKYLNNQTCQNCSTNVWKMNTFLTVLEYYIVECCLEQNKSVERFVLEVESFGSDAPRSKCKWANLLHTTDLWVRQ